MCTYLYLGPRHFAEMFHNILGYSGSYHTYHWSVASGTARSPHGHKHLPCQFGYNIMGSEGEGQRKSEKKEHGADKSAYLLCVDDECSVESAKLQRRLAVASASATTPGFKTNESRPIPFPRDTFLYIYICREREIFLISTMYFIPTQIVSWQFRILKKIPINYRNIRRISIYVCSYTYLLNNFLCTYCEKLIFFSNYTQVNSYYSIASNNDIGHTSIQVL